MKMRLTDELEHEATAHAVKRVLLALLLLFFCGCPTGSDKKPSNQQSPCTKFGQTCQVSPGKLGSCVVREGCTEGNCFVCQSQH